MSLSLTTIILNRILSNFYRNKFLIASIYIFLFSGFLFSEESNDLSCDTKSNLYEVSKTTQPKLPFNRSTTPQSVSIDLVYDLSFKEKHGTAGAEKLISNIIEITNLVFAKNLGLKLKVLRVQYLDIFEETSSIPKIYDQLKILKRSYKGSILHLFSAKPFGNLHGAAYEIGSVCRASNTSFSFSISNSRSNLTNVFMHEIAHNLGASHILSTPKTIMSPNLNSGTTRLVHSQTKGEIKLFLDSFGSCEIENTLDITGASTPDSLALEVFKSNRRRRQVQFLSFVKLNDLPLTLNVEALYKRRKRAKFSRVVKQSRSNQLGMSKIRVKREGFYQLRVQEFPDRVSKEFRIRRK